MSDLLKDHEGVVVVMDDVRVYGSSEEEHDQHLETVLWTIKQSGLKLKRSKCHFNKTELPYFGHIISAGGIKPDTSKVRAITEMPRPTNVGELCQMLGFINYVGKFLPGLSTTLHPLNELHRTKRWKKPKPGSHQHLHSPIMTPTSGLLSVQMPTVMVWGLHCCKTTMVS